MLLKDTWPLTSLPLKEFFIFLARYIMHFHSFYYNCICSFSLVILDYFDLQRSSLSMPDVLLCSQMVTLVLFGKRIESFPVSILVWTCIWYRFKYSCKSTRIYGSWNENTCSSNSWLCPRLKDLNMVIICREASVLYKNQMCLLACLRILEKLRLFFHVTMPNLGKSTSNIDISSPASLRTTGF